ncbi:trafficking protein particle complex subunit 2-like protein [Oppia nitens]|uniref:trafficking protein particle complex subunit 2-like protein n=1 Tax=Oppia nitens TaxID=1686743 RepID=UPI0023DC503E|nr:trafficking protein particle complex subunit 2-like protein [Oppia nitens]
MAVSTLVIVNRENVPLVVRSRTPMSSTDTISSLFHMHSCLDIINEKQSNRDQFIGVVTQTESHKIYGFCSTTNTKILLMVTPQAFRDNEARLIMKSVHNTYVNVTSGNPFYQFGQQIKSKHLDQVIDAIFSNY